MPFVKARPLNGRLEVKGHQVPYSFWPTAKRVRRNELQSTLFTTDPWSVIEGTIRSDKSPGARTDEAIALLAQAKDYYRAGFGAGISAAKPVLQYYAYLNLAKAFLVHREKTPMEAAQHGLSEKLHPGNRELVDAYLESYKTGSKNNVFDRLRNALTGSGQASEKERFDIPAILPQIVPGHRLWVAATGLSERFIAVDDIVLGCDTVKKEAWLSLIFKRGSLRKLYISQKEILTAGDLQNEWRRVDPDPEFRQEGCVQFEQLNTIPYLQHPSQIVGSLCESAKQRLWTTVLSTPPYRRYYVYLSPTHEVTARLPQLLSMYALAYYLGSITRYRPHHFDKVANSDYGPFIESCLNDLPPQFLYLMASEFAEQEVTRPALV